MFEEGGSGGLGCCVQEFRRALVVEQGFWDGGLGSLVVLRTT